MVMGWLWPTGRPWAEVTSHFFQNPPLLLSPLPWDGSIPERGCPFIQDLEQSPLEGEWQPEQGQSCPRRGGQQEREINLVSAWELGVVCFYRITVILIPPGYREPRGWDQVWGNHWRKWQGSTSSKHVPTDARLRAPDSCWGGPCSTLTLQVGTFPCWELHTGTFRLFPSKHLLCMKGHQCPAVTSFLNCPPLPAFASRLFCSRGVFPHFSAHGTPRDEQHLTQPRNRALILGRKLPRGASALDTEPPWWVGGWKEVQVFQAEATAGEKVQKQEKKHISRKMWRHFKTSRVGEETAGLSKSRATGGF